MPTVLHSVRPNLLGGLLTDTVQIDSGLTIIAGANGTGKSRFLESVKAGTSPVDLTNDDGEATLQIIAFSPKRNSTKRAFRELVDESVSQNRKLANRLQDLINSAFQDNTFTEYPSFSEMFFHAFRRNDSPRSTNHISALNQTISEFNKIVQTIFADMELWGDWNDADGVPELSIKKKQIDYPIQINDISTGEQEILSLIVNINTAAENSNLILIDEPELHLNWGLEQKLFNYLKSFSNEHNVQIIVTTHSRVVGLPEYRDLVRYFYWDNKKVSVGNSLPEDQIEAVAGEAIQFVQAIPHKRATIFVEDRSQKAAVEALAKLYGRDLGKIDVLITRDKGTVKNLFIALKRNDSLNEATIDAYFLIDGDGDKKISSEKYFIQLDKYSIESYLFADLEILKKISGLRQQTFDSRILNGLRNYELKGEKKNAEVLKLFLSHAQLDRGVLSSKIYDSIDCKSLAKSLGVESADRIGAYILELGKNKASKVFDRKLIQIIKSLP